MDKWIDRSDTVRMRIPLIKRGEILFICPDKPGQVFVGTKEYMNYYKSSGDRLFEISWEQGVVMLNSDDGYGKCKLTHYMPFKDSNDEIPVVWDIGEVV